MLNKKYIFKYTSNNIYISCYIILFNNSYISFQQRIDNKDI